MTADLQRLEELYGRYPETWSQRYGYVTWFRAQHDDWPFLASTPEISALIAALHNAFPSLLARIRELEADVAKVIRQRDLWDATCQSLKSELAAAEARAAAMQGEPDEDALDSVRGFMQAIRNIPGCTFAQARTHCLARGDDVSAWPDIQGYVTEQAAALTIYNVISAARSAKEE